MSITKTNPDRQVSKMFPEAIVNDALKKYHNDPVITKKVEKGRQLLEKLKLS